MCSCAVAMCHSGGRKKKPGITFHRFPIKNPGLCKVWVAKCQRADKFAVQNAKMCSKHFTEADYVRDLRNELLGLPLKKRLKPDAIPSVFHCRTGTATKESINNNNNCSSTPSSSELRKLRMERKRNKELVESLLRESENSSSRPENSKEETEEANLIFIKLEPGDEIIHFQTQEFDPLESEGSESPENQYQIKMEPDEEDEDQALEFDYQNQGEELQIKTEIELENQDQSQAEDSVNPEFFEYSNSIKTEPELEQRSQVSVTTPLSNVYFMVKLDDDNNNKKKFTCELCNQTFKHPKSFRSHEIKKHGQFQCSMCNLRFSTSNNLQLHQHRKHQVPLNLTCDLCNSNRIYTSSLNLKIHKKIHEKATSRYPCPDSNCNEAFIQRALLDHHLKLKHKEDRLYKCEICSKTFIVYRKLSEHQLRAHPKQKLWICEKCGLPFANECLLKIHSTVHTGEKDFKCPEPGCDKLFRLKSNMTSHYKKVHLKK